MLCGSAGPSSRVDGSAQSKPFVLPNPLSKVALGRQSYGFSAFAELKMALEIERRFLVVGDAWRAHAGHEQHLRQGYLAASADGVTVRMRLRGVDQAWLTLKAAADRQGLIRHEFEYEIPVADAEALWALAPHRLEKTRYSIDWPGGDWVVDCFSGANAPLVLAEVELATADAALQLPSWCGLELTGESRWSNAVLAAEPLEGWPLTERQALGLV